MAAVGAAVRAAVRASVEGFSSYDRHLADAPLPVTFEGEEREKVGRGEQLPHVKMKQ